MISPGALNLCSVTAGDSPASSAPGAGNPSGAPPFGQQLRDARESLNTKADAASAQGAGGQAQTKQPQSDAQDASASSTDAASNPADNAPQPAPARGTDARRAGKKDPGDDPRVAVPVAGLAPRPAVLPFALNFPLLSVETPNAPAADRGAAASGGTSGMPGQADTSEPGTSESKAAPDPSMAPAEAQPLAADLAFALKLNPQENGDAASHAGGVTPNASDAASGASDASKNDLKDPAAPSLSPSAARAEVSSQTAAAAVAPVKNPHRGEQDAEAPPAPPPQPAPMARGAAATVFQAPEKSAPGEAAATAAPARPDVNKALAAEPLQTEAAMPSNKTSGPLRDLSIQVGQAQQDRVELRVVERSGELQVAVRAANPDVAQGLRQGLSELSDRLEQNGFRAEAWRPGVTTSTVQGAADTRQKSTQFQDDGSQPQSGGSRQGRQQNGQNQSSRPKWVQELEGSLTGGGTTRTGESYGITR